MQLTLVTLFMIDTNAWTKMLGYERATLVPYLNNENENQKLHK